MLLMASDHSYIGVLRWQSRLVVVLTVAPVFALSVTQAAALTRYSPATLVTALLIGLGFGLLVWGLRAATPAAALTGSLFTFALYFAAPGWRTLLWPLLALFLLTFGATRFGRARKEELLVAEEKRGRSASQVAEEKRGRSASQVAANLGAAAVASLFAGGIRFGHYFFVLAVRERQIPRTCFLVALIAALAEATADTLSSELGEVLGGEPVLLTTLRRVPPGTDGAISLAGTAAGCVGAGVIVLIAAAILPLSWPGGIVAMAAGIAGLFFDSLLGATLERRGWLNNDAVNFLSTCAAAVSGWIVTLEWTR
jgi:uncharacterized protein (TIGR00297 family)